MELNGGLVKETRNYESAIFLLITLLLIYNSFGSPTTIKCYV